MTVTLFAPALEFCAYQVSVFQPPMVAGPAARVYVFPRVSVRPVGEAEELSLSTWQTIRLPAKMLDGKLPEAKVVDDVVLASCFCLQVGVAAQPAGFMNANGTWA